jgi:pyrrolidone-carboxylate peptidase
MVSRGLNVTSFNPLAEVTKKILITGFDPFNMDVEGMDIGNPSGAVVLALDGTTITNGACSAQIRGVVFPVRYNDFDNKIVETYLRNFLTGPNKADMIMTISRGDRVFELERWAARARSGSADNNNQNSGRGELDTSLTGLYGGRGRRDEFIESTLPFSEMTVNNAAKVDSTYKGTSAGISVNQNSNPVPPAGAVAVSGSGGDFLSNEIFYRVRLLELNENSTIPMGHLHIPIATQQQYPFIVNGVRSILINSLTSLCPAS